MNREQIRAENAFRSVGAATGDGADLLGLARTLPVMLQTNGLLATWAHLLAKSRKQREHAQVLEILLDHLRTEALGFGAEVDLGPATARAAAMPAGDARKVFEDRWLAARPPLAGARLRALTSETIAFSVWLKRAAEALLDSGDEDQDEGAVGEPLP